MVSGLLANNTPLSCAVSRLSGGARLNRGLCNHIVAGTKNITRIQAVRLPMAGSNDHVGVQLRLSSQMLLSPCIDGWSYG